MAAQSLLIVVAGADERRASRVRPAFIEAVNWSGSFSRTAVVFKNLPR
jgi:hypothetical protein